MILTASRLANDIRKGNTGDAGGVSVVPTPDLTYLETSGEASLSLRLGRWFLTLRQSSETHIGTVREDDTRENKISKRHFVRFGDKFVLHPGRFVLGSTLEWIKLPTNYAAFVVGKSTLGRRGIIIETAAGVHPGFSGCLTLEIANVGEVPIILRSGMLICQLFFHLLEGEVNSGRSALAGQRKPRLGRIREDYILNKLIESTK